MMGAMLNAIASLFRRRDPRLGARIAVTSFLILFLELLLIRWLAAYFLHLAYFSNLVLLASFFGIGIGCLLAGRKNLFPCFPYVLLLVVLLVLFRIDMVVMSPEVLYFQELSPDRAALPFWLVLPLLFVTVAAVFVGPAQLLGNLFRRAEPLTAYAWDIGGSIAGIIAFALLSSTVAGPLWFLSVAGPIGWFSVVAAAYLWLARAEHGRSEPKQIAALAAALLAVIPLTLGTIWSPYYKIVVTPIIGSAGYTIFANETGHQTMQRPAEKEWIYFTPYELFEDPRYEDVLIIGAGSGSDVALALEKGARRIDAVDIDPTIVALGKKLHPSRPYDDPRVTPTIDDGRAFLERSDRQYDLIIFALTDSLALASSYSNTRLESYLFTKESFEAAKRRLSPDGLLVLYNYYREPWLVAKLAGTLEDVFGQRPYVAATPSGGFMASMMVGPGLAKLSSDALPSAEIPELRLPPATDEWPFPYLVRPGLPSSYLIIIALLAAIVLGTMRLVRRRSGNGAFPWHFFFLGAGFLLLETKNIVNFQLLFGATWFVNVMVFTAILLMVLAAVALHRAGFRPGPRFLYAALALTLLANLLVPLRTLSDLPTVTRYVVASLLTLSPVFFANLVFADSFQRSKRADENFAANLLGAMVGGLSEFAAMAVGYHWLIVLAMGYYAASWVMRRRVS